MADHNNNDDNKYVLRCQATTRSAESRDNNLRVTKSSCVDATETRRRHSDVTLASLIGDVTLASLSGDDNDDASWSDDNRSALIGNDHKTTGGRSETVSYRNTPVGI